MPYADEHLADAAPTASPSSPRLVRSLLLGAGAVGLVGLSLPSTPSQDMLATVTVTPAAAYTAVVEVAPSPVALPALPRAVAQPAAKPVAKRASRTRKAVEKASTTTWYRPSSAGIGSYYGIRWGKMHKGLDFNGSTGDAIRAVGAGTVVGSGYLGSESGYGMISIIRHSNGYYSAYAHQSKSYVDAGDQVDAGQTIGLIGSTGHSTGSHLHFEIRTQTHGGQVNPLTWLREHGVNV